MLKLFKISGNSLYPFYKDGERVLCHKIFKFNIIKKSDTVVFSKKGYGRMIKKVLYIRDEKYFVQGTEAFSVDSRDFGAIGRDEIEYRVLF